MSGDDYSLKPYVENYPAELEQLEREVMGLNLTIESISKNDYLGALPNLIEQKKRAEDRIAEIKEFL